MLQSSWARTRESPFPPSRVQHCNKARRYWTSRTPVNIGGNIGILCYTLKPLRSALFISICYAVTLGSPLDPQIARESLFEGVKDVPARCPLPNPDNPGAMPSGFNNAAARLWVIGLSFLPNSAHGRPSIPLTVSTRSRDAIRSTSLMKIAWMSAKASAARRLRPRRQRRSIARQSRGHSLATGRRPPRRSPAALASCRHRG